MNPLTARVLIVCERLPLPVRGGSDLHVLGVAQAMSAVADVGVVALSSSAAGPAPAYVELWQAGAIATPDAATLLRHAFTQPDDPFAPYASADAISTTRGAIEAFQPTVVVFYRLQAWRLAEAVLEGRDVVAILDLDESLARSVRALESLGRRDDPTRVRVRFTRSAARYERVAVASAAGVWVCTPFEAEELRPSVSPGRLSIVHNVVDPIAYSGRGFVREPRRLVFPANFSYPPNEEAARELADVIAAMLPDHVIALVGSYLPAWLRAHSAPNVVAEGPVESVVGHLHAASAAMMPIRAGTGSRMKVLECLASETPIVSTDIGVEGLGLLPGRHYLHARSAEEFAAAARRLGDDPGLVRRLTAEGLSLVRERHSIESLVPVVAEAIARAVDAQSTPVASG